MRRNQLLLQLAAVLPLSLAGAGCASTENSQGLTRVDDLLTRIEQVQVETVVAREKASAAFDAFGQIVAPDFSGDPMLAFQALVAGITASKQQADRLGSMVGPMKETAENVFLSWTADLEKFGNTNLRQASQSRLAETRMRYSAVHNAATAAMVAIDAFNSDLSDQALFLEHDFNADSVSVIAAQVPALTNQARDLGKRLQECVAASKQYIAASALRGQLEPAAPQTETEVAVDGPLPAPARKLPNPMAEGEPEPQAAPMTTTAPARRRPRTNGESTATPTTAPAQEPATAAPTTPSTTSAPGTTSSPNTQPTSITPLPVLGTPAPRPETDLTPKPSPIVPTVIGGRR